MRRPEEYASSIDRSDDNEHYADQDFTYNDVCRAIEQAQKEAYNQALEDAAKSAMVEYIDLTSDKVFDYTDVISDDDVAARISKQSILKLKIK